MTKYFFPRVDEAYKILSRVQLTPFLAQTLTEHNGFAQYLHKFKLKNSPHCACAPDNVQDLLRFSRSVRRPRRAPASKSASRSPILLAVRRTKLCRSELPADNAMRRFNAPQPFLLLPRVPILRFCDAFVTNFTAAEFRALYCSSTQEECSSS
ncbi:hypothetical protein EVAR_91980_1 [Eumeta japonica]|uniref:Uncharacterized protein n=1 Tax=Eumeta variegata TaxID=151549 RepID=A0A4C2AFN9_EUMVA|nr:hypothetical protein EVAR_91980_1 [Eumeta japonica]